jgi:hypothetical protein
LLFRVYCAGPVLFHERSQPSGSVSVVGYKKGESQFFRAATAMFGTLHQAVPYTFGPAARQAAGAAASKRLKLG